MMRSMVVISVAALLSGCESASPPAQHMPAGHQSADEVAVLGALDRYMTAISEKDYAAQAAMQTPDGMTYQWRPSPDGGMHITAHPNAYWSDPSRDDGRALRERYWSPSVMIRGGIAVVWAPYEFWIDGKKHHCGIDVVDFVKLDGKWLVANAMWTVEPDGCAELRPEGTATLRPED